MAAWFADLVLVLHLAFVVFAVGGGLLAIRWPRLVWAHLAAAGWATAVELFGWSCPLTPLENALRSQAGEAVDGRDFVARVLLPLLYPAGLTRETQVALGLAVLLFNLGVYAWWWLRRRRR